MTLPLLLRFPGTGFSAHGVNRREVSLRPLIVLSYLIDYSIWGFTPAGYHLTNILVHSLNACLVFLLFNRLFSIFCEHDDYILSALAGLFFLVLSSHTESVTWIAGRGDVIAATFGLGATLLLVFLLQRFSMSAFVGFIILFSFSLLSKESAIVLPGVWAVMLVSYLVVQRQKVSHRHVVVLLTGFALLAAYFMARRLVLGHFIGGYGTESHLDLMRIDVAQNVLIFLVRSFMPPPPLWVYRILVHSMFLPVFGFVTVIGASALFRFRHHLQLSKVILFTMFALSFFVCLMPVATMGVSIIDTQGERFLYLPTVFASAAAVTLGSMLIKRRSLMLITTSLFILVEAVALQVVNERWITAAQLTRKIAMEVARHDPSRAIILNIPDNFQGAYVFRTGLHEAATTFLGNEVNGRYRVISWHAVNSLGDTFDVSASDDKITLVVPKRAQRVRKIQNYGLPIERTRYGIAISKGITGIPRVKYLLSYHRGASKSIIRTIGLRTTTDGAPRALSTTPLPSHQN